jgi:hypothetical protein
MFAKIDLHLPEIDISRLKGQLFENHHDQFVMYDLADADYITQLFQDKVKFNMCPSKIGYFEICGDGAPPHTDGYVGCSLNIIIEAADCITSFWKLKDKDYTLLDTIKIDKDGNTHNTNTVGYQYEDLDFVSLFKANSGEAWLLDVREIHSVIKPEFGRDRKVLTLRWDPTYSFQEVLDSIKIL